MHLSYSKDESGRRYEHLEEETETNLETQEEWLEEEVGEIEEGEGS